MTPPASRPAPVAPAPPAIPDPLIPQPPALAAAVEGAFLAKALKPRGEMFLLSMAAGAMIGLGFILFITSQQGLAGGDFPVGLGKVIGGFVFSVGLWLVVITGADLFTGTTLTVMPLLSRRLGVAPFLTHWCISLLGNLIGAVALAVLVLIAGTHASNGGAWGLVVLNSSLAKVSYPWFQAFMLAILANMCVCLGLWAATSGKTTFDKLVGVAGPLTLFVATGFEHSVANMFMLPMGLLVKYGAGDAFWQGKAVEAAGKTVEDYAALTVGSVVWDNFIPVILGNIVGGALVIGAFFWLSYRRSALAAERG